MKKEELLKSQNSEENVKEKQIYVSKYQRKYTLS